MEISQEILDMHMDDEMELDELLEGIVASFPCSGLADDIMLSNTPVSSSTQVFGARRAKSQTQASPLNTDIIRTERIAVYETPSSCKRRKRKPSRRELRHVTEFVENFRCNEMFPQDPQGKETELITSGTDNPCSQLFQRSTVFVPPSSNANEHFATAVRLKGSNSGSANKTCHCARSNCLKRYCVCFINQVYCNKSCRCKSCLNCLSREGSPFPAWENLLARTKARTEETFTH